MPRSSTAALRKKRGSVHGDFNVGAAIAQGTTDLWRAGPNWAKLNATQKESLVMIAHKVQRILLGDPSFPDHWDDIAGYAHLPLIGKAVVGKSVRKQSAKRPAKPTRKARKAAVAKKRTMSAATKKKIADSIRARSKKKKKLAAKKPAAKRVAKKRARKAAPKRAVRRVRNGSGGLAMPTSPGGEA